MVHTNMRSYHSAHGPGDSFLSVGQRSGNGSYAVALTIFSTMLCIEIADAFRVNERWQPLTNRRQSDSHRRESMNRTYMVFDGIRTIAEWYCVIVLSNAVMTLSIEDLTPFTSVWFHESSVARLTLKEV